MRHNLLRGSKISLFAVFILIITGVAVFWTMIHVSMEKPSLVGMAVELNVHSAAAWVANDKDWFREYKIDFTTLETYVAGLTLAAALARGDIQVGWICLSPAILTYARGVSVKIVALTHMYGYALVVRPEICDIEELSGKTIGCVREGSPCDLLLNVLIERYDLTDVKILRMNPLKLLEAMTGGTIDAAFAPEHYATVIESKGFTVLVKAQDLWPNFPGSVLVVKEELIQRNPEAVRRLVEITLRATNWIVNHPDEAAEIVGDNLETAPELIKKSMSRLEYTTEINLVSFQEVIDFLVKLEYIEKGIKAENIVDLSFLQELQGEDTIEKIC
jgi:NitT/TauT family transport system substrate-binding protein